MTFDVIQKNKNDPPWSTWLQEKDLIPWIEDCSLFQPKFIVAATIHTEIALIQTKLQQKKNQFSSRFSRKYRENSRIPHSHGFWKFGKWMSVQRKSGWLFYVEMHDQVTQCLWFSEHVICLPITNEIAQQGTYFRPHAHQPLSKVRAPSSSNLLIACFIMISLPNLVEEQNILINTKQTITSAVPCTPPHTSQARSSYVSQIIRYVLATELHM